MKFLGMGVPELLIILAVVLLIFGPKNLPKLGASLGKTVKNIRDGMSDSDNKDKDDSDDKEAAKIEKEAKADKKKSTSKDEEKPESDSDSE